MPVFEDMERADYAQFRFLLSPGPAAYFFPAGEKCAHPIHVVGPTSGNPNHPNPAMGKLATGKLELEIKPAPKD